MERNKFPVCISLGNNFHKDEEKIQKYLDTYEWSNDGCLQYVTAVIHNEIWDILVGFNKKHWSWQIPSGKIDKWESHQISLEREMNEEISLQIKEIKNIWTSKVILNGMVWQWHFYDTQVEWTLNANEVDTAEEYKRVNFIETDTWLWFWITDGKVTIIDPLEILQYRHMFAEIFWSSKFSLYKWLMWSAVSIPSNLDKEEKYIQYRDTEKNSLEIEKYQDFLKIIEVW